MAARGGDTPPPMEAECAEWLSSLPGDHTPESPLGQALRRQGFIDLPSMDFSEQDLTAYTQETVPVGQLRRFRREAVSMLAARNLGEMTRPQDAPVPAGAGHGYREPPPGGLARAETEVRPVRPDISPLPGAAKNAHDVGFAGIGSATAFNGFVTDVINYCGSRVMSNPGTMAAAVKALRQKPTGAELERLKGTIVATDDSELAQALVPLIHAEGKVFAGEAVLESRSGLTILQTFLEPMRGGMAVTTRLRLQELDQMAHEPPKNKGQLHEWLRHYDNVARDLEALGQAPTCVVKENHIRQASQHIKEVRDAITTLETYEQISGQPVSYTAFRNAVDKIAIDNVGTASRKVAMIATRAKSYDSDDQHDEVPVAPRGRRGGDGDKTCHRWRSDGTCHFGDECYFAADHVRAAKGKKAAAPKKAAKKKKKQGKKVSFEGPAATLGDDDDAPEYASADESDNGGVDHAGVERMIRGAAHAFMAIAGVALIVFQFARLTHLFGDGKVDTNETQGKESDPQSKTCLHTGTGGHEGPSPSSRKRAMEETLLDTGADGDLLGAPGQAVATNIKHVKAAKVTSAGADKTTDEVATWEISHGLGFYDAYVAPWCPFNLISLKPRRECGWTWWGTDDTITLQEPDGAAEHDFVDAGPGLFRYKRSRGIRGGTRRKLKNNKRRRSTAEESKVTTMASITAAAKACVDKLFKHSSREAKKAAAKAHQPRSKISGYMMLMLTLMTAVAAVSQSGHDGAVIPRGQLEKLFGTAPKAIPRARRKEMSQYEHEIHGHYPFNKLCDACVRGRMTGKPGYRRPNKFDIDMKDKGFVLGVDFYGPFESDVSGNTWALIAVEVARTNYGFVRLLPNKEAPAVREALKDIAREIKVKSKDDIDVVRVHSDVDGSMQAETRDWLREAGIKQTDTGGYNPQNNARAERRIRMLTEAFRSSFLTATGGNEVYNGLWGAGLQYQNTQANKQTFVDGTVPHEALTGEAPQWNRDDHIFGAHAIYYVPLDARSDKFETPGQRGLWVGRSEMVSGGAKIVPIEWQPDLNRWELGEVKHVAKATVNDAELPLKMGPGKLGRKAKEQTTKFLNKFHVAGYKSTPPEAYEEYQIEGEDPVWEVEKIESKRGKGKKAKYTIKWKGSDERTEEPLSHLTGCQDLLEKFETELKVTAKRDNPARTPQKQKGRTRAAGVAVTEDGNTRTDEDPDAQAVSELITQQRQTGTIEEWLPGYKKELEEVRRRRLRRITDDGELKTAEAAAVRLRMNLEPKHDGRRKARLILQGFREPREWDGGPTDAPVAAMATIRSLIYMITPAGWSSDVISSIDVATAFLQAEEYDPTDDPRYVKYRPHNGAMWEYYQLNGPIYGQRAASKRWFDTLAKWMKEEGFIQGKNEPCVFHKKDIVVVVWVDDCLVRGTSAATATFYKKLAKRFDMKDPSYLTEHSPLTFVGCDITMKTTTRPGRKHKAVGINQDIALQRFFEEYGVTGDGPDTRSPMATAAAMATDTTLLTTTRAERFQRQVGSLNYFASTSRYDVSQAVGRLSQVTGSPTVSAEKELHRVLRYLAQHPHLSLSTERKGTVNHFEFYSDSDHAGDKLHTTKSTTGTIFLMNGAPVHWASKKQNSKQTAYSSAAAEIYALSESARSAQLLVWRAEEMGMAVKWPLVLRVDNTQSIAFQRNTCLQSRLRGVIDLRKQWVQELRDLNKIATAKIHTDENLADIFTKCLPGYKFQEKLNQIELKQLQREIVACTCSWGSPNFRGSIRVGKRGTRD
jgi:hypothetical protein